MPVLKRPDYTLYYTMEGRANAPLLVLSNSLGADHTMWNLQAPVFSKRFRVLRYDNRGHGQSTAPPGPYTLEQVATDVLLLLAEVGERSAHFCGLSLGGMVGMWLATKRRETIQKLILCNTSALLGPRENWDTRIAATKAGGMQAVSKTVMERWFTEGFRNSSPEVVNEIEQTFLKSSVEGYNGCCAAIRDMDQRASIARIGAPTMVIAGTHDPSTPPALGQSIAETIPGTRYVELPSAHLSNIECAAMFNDAVLQFLS